jgi:hypothetical protein
VRGLVNDAVEGLVGDAEPKVTVNGVTAKVGDRYFIATGVPLNVGDNTLTVTATDQVGNARTSTIKVTRILVGTNRISVVGGNNQTGAINAELAKPLTAVAFDAQGQPLANKVLTFDMLRGTGRIAATQGGTGSRNLLVTTDNTGQASVYFTTGKQSGFANNVVRVSAADIPEEALFYATAQAGTAAHINADMLGVNQRAEAGAKVLEPLVAIVTDAGDNRVAGTSVTFKVEEGDASFDGQAQTTLLTDKNGIATARPTMGLIPGQCLITATVDQTGATSLATAFTVTSLAASNQPTGFSGIVLNDRNQPLAGVTLSIGRTPLTVTADAQGKFTFDANVPAGKIDLFVDGRTATGLSEIYPALHFEVLAVRGQDNRLPHPIFMPPLNTPETRTVGGDQDVVLRIPGIEGFQMKVFANSVTFPDGTKTGPLVVSRVNQDKLPMVPPGGASIFMAPAWTIQPASTRFDPPIQVTLPNTQGLKAGESRNIYQWDHDLATFVPIGRATVNEDASFLVTDAGSGVTKAGWGGAPPPPPNPGSCGEGAPKKCTECEMLSTNAATKCTSCVPLDSAPTISIAVTPAFPTGDAGEFLSTTTVTATATLSGAGANADAKKIKWEVISLNGKAKGILAPTPPSKTGETFSFKADNVPSTDGSYSPTKPLEFEIKATYCTASATTPIKQDEKDIIRQEYEDFRGKAYGPGTFTLATPAKAEFNPLGTYIGQVDPRMHRPYTVGLGDPWGKANLIAADFNTAIKAWSLAEYNKKILAIVPDMLFDTLDQFTAKILELKTLETERATMLASNYYPQLNSAYRSPRHNLEAGSSSTRSSHIRTGAVDIKLMAVPPNMTTPPANLEKAWQMLQTTSESIYGRAFCETKTDHNTVRTCPGVLPYDLDHGTVLTDVGIIHADCGATALSCN